ncbi:MAG: dihydrofolate reductase [Burkholderiales bacterium]|nr:dihydrofolate reductase [Burkholderiales bacterium]
MTAPQKPRLSMIVAMAKNRVIGADGKIPWHLPNELQLFKRVTMGHHIIMGRKTFDSIGRLLPGRTTVIVTRQKDYAVAGAKVAHSLDAAVALCAGDDEIFVIGGGELYRAALPQADRIYLTVVEVEPSGDTKMPEFEGKNWLLTSTQRFYKDERHAHDYRFEVHDRVAH